MTDEKSNLYAIVETGGKQELVREGEVVRVEKLAAAAGEVVELKPVLLVAGDGELQVGQPEVPKAKVLAEVLGDTKGRKIKVFKIKRRKGYRKKTGHRQKYTQVRIKGIELGEKSKKSA